MGLGLNTSGKGSWERGEIHILSVINTLNFVSSGLVADDDIFGLEVSLRDIIGFYFYEIYYVTIILSLEICSMT